MQSAECGMRSDSALYTLDSALLLVGMERVELSCPCGHLALNQARLPFRHIPVSVLSILPQHLGVVNEFARRIPMSTGSRSIRRPRSRGRWASSTAMTSFEQGTTGIPPGCTPSRLSPDRSRGLRASPLTRIGRRTMVQLTVSPARPST